MSHRKPDRKSSAASRNRITIFGGNRKNQNERDENSYSDQNEEGDYNDPDKMLKKAIDQKRGTFKRPPKPVYDSWNLPEEASIKPTPTHAGKGPKGYRRSDERIREDVCEALSAHPEIDASDMEVDVKEGVVYFTGSVESRLVKRMAEDLIEHIPGVMDVRNELYFSNGAPLLKSNGNGKRKHQDSR